MLRLPPYRIRPPRNQQSIPFPRAALLARQGKSVQYHPKKNSQIKALWQVELNNLDALLISHFTLDADNIVQGDIQDYASLTGQLHRTFHQLNTEDGAGILRIITQSP